MSPKEDKIKVCSINIQGWSERSKITLDHYTHKHKFAAVAVQETTTNDVNRLKLTNMKVMCDNNKSKNRGAAIYINDKFPTTKLKDLNETSKHTDSSWCLAVIHNKRYIIGSVYVNKEYQMGIDDVIKMLNKAHESMKKLKAVGVILTGDFNARHSTWGDHKTDENGKKLFKDLDTNKFAIITSSTPTFLAKNGSSVIDLTIVTTNLVEKVECCKTDTEVELWSGAPFRGHVPLITTLKSTGYVTNKEAIEKIGLDKICWETWSEDLENKLHQNEEYLKNVTNPQVLGNFLDTSIHSVTMKHGEKKLISTHSRPYWTEELDRLCSNMREARKAYTKRNTDSNEQKLKDAKELFDEARKKECESFILKQTDGMNKTERLKFWKEFNKLFRKKTNQNIDLLMNSDNTILSCPRDMEECMFSTFFEGDHLEGANFDEKFYQETNQICEEILSSNLQEGEEDQTLKDLNSEITMQEIKSSIKGYKASGKSSDKEMFNPKMFKHLGTLALQQILRLANQCLEQGRWIWNKSEVIFLKKAGKDSYSKPGSYRPISISSYIGKLIEKIIAKRIQNYLNLIGCHDPDQEGFMEQKNTIRYLNRLVLGIKADAQKQLTSICLFIDFEKAFDSVWQKGLIVKMYNMGIKGKLLNLIHDFLVNRKITLNINGVVGPIRNCSDIGLPQGSALSPVLFRIFVMDIAEELKNRKDVAIFKFADDGTIKVTSNTTTNACVKTLDNVLKVIDAWTKRWRMIINCNPDKTEVIGFCTTEGNRNLIPTTFKLGNKTINRVSKTKVLGLVIDEELNFKDHSHYVYTKMVRLWNTICQHSNRHWGFNQNVLTFIIKTLLLPTLFYASHIWMDKKNMKDIDSLHYKIIKSAVGAVFNIRKTFAEILLGIPPITITNNINQIKHYLKLNMTQIPEDRLQEFVEEELKNNDSKVHHSLRQVFIFLKWKLLNYPKNIPETDKIIIQSGNIEQYFQLSPATCEYNKTQMTKYTELIWNYKIKNELQQEGQVIVPTAETTNIPIPKQAIRKAEVLMMSMFYPNNLLNSFTNPYDSTKFPSPTCNCGEDQQTAHHVLFRCQNIDINLRDEAYEAFRQVVGDEADIDCHLVLLKACKNKVFIEKSMKVIEHQQNHLKTEIIL